MKRALLIVALLSLSFVSAAPAVSADQVVDEECVGEEGIVAVCERDGFGQHNRCWLDIWTLGNDMPVCFK